MSGSFTSAGQTGGDEAEQQYDHNRRIVWQQKPAENQSEACSGDGRAVVERSVAALSRRSTCSSCIAGTRGAWAEPIVRQKLQLAQKRN